MELETNGTAQQTDNQEDQIEEEEKPLTVQRRKVICC